MHRKMIDLVARRFQVLGEPCRLRILQALEAADMSVSEIVDRLQGNQPNISKHLQILFDAGLVSRERSGNNMLYRVADPMVFQLCALVCRSTVRRAASLQKYAIAWRTSTGQSRRTYRTARGRSLRGGN